MIIKCGHYEVEVDEKDEILYNGACYQIITRGVGTGWNTYHPIIAKDKAKKMIKDGRIYLEGDSKKYKDCKIYKFREAV